VAGGKAALKSGRDSGITLAMLSKVCSAAVNGIEAYPLEVEVNAGWGDTLVVLVGLISPNPKPVIRQTV
jgi:hypothetical protein